MATLQTLYYMYMYSEVPLITPPMVVVESGLNSEQVSSMKPICIENCILVLKQVVLIVRVVLISSGLYCVNNQIFNSWSFENSFTILYMKHRLCTEKSMPVFVLILW